MTPAYSDAWLTIHGGDCRDVLRTLPADSVHCVITSPPYWGLRDYGTASWDGGDADCDHKGAPVPTQAGFNERWYGRPPTEGNKQDDGRREVFRTVCGKCGARRVDAQLGLEATPEAYVAAMVDVFREVHRVLRPDGVLFLNLGDSYATGGNGVTVQQADRERHAPLKAIYQAEGRSTGQHGGWEGRASHGKGTAVGGLKPKDLVGIPWRVAFALQADGWYLRSDIVWAKPNPMPESVTDRPTKAHEYVFLLSKSARYFYDADAVREANSATSHPGTRRSEWKYAAGKAMEKSAMRVGMSNLFNGRNLRSVWTIATAPYPGAHFATFPPRLVEPMVKAGTSERGVCPQCGAPWTRETDVTYVKGGSGGPSGKVGTAAGMVQPLPVRMTRSTETTGWRPTCDHGGDPVPATVLDPFAGTGTVGLVAQSLSRRALLIDLNPEYLVQCLGRNRQVPLGV
jgi:DNA modification methylase